MGFRAVKPVEPHWYEPDADEFEIAEDDVDGLLGFKVKGLNATQKTDIYDQMTAAGKGNPGTFRDCFKLGCVAIRHCKNPSGGPLVHPLEFLQLTDPRAISIMLNVGNYIFDLAFELEEEKKTSSSASQSH